MPKAKRHYKAYFYCENCKDVFVEKIVFGCPVAKETYRVCPNCGYDEGWHVKKSLENNAGVSRKLGQVISVIGTKRIKQISPVELVGKEEADAESRPDPQESG